MIPYIVYSNTGYLDILEIQTNYLKNVENKILLINDNQNHNKLYENYKQIIFYDDTLPYASRLLQLSKLSYDYILFTHDIDILLNKNDSVINDLLELMISKNLDRIDLQYYKYGKSDSNIEINSNGQKFFLNKQSNPNHYIYNVNPSIWKLSSFIEILEKFKNKTYRNIEEYDVQNFCEKYKIYKLWSENYLEIGYYHCLPFYQFLHITHAGELLPIENNGLNNDINDEYRLICQKYLSNGNRTFRKNRW